MQQAIDPMNDVFSPHSEGLLMCNFCDADTRTVVVCRPFYLLAFDAHKITGEKIEPVTEESPRLIRRVHLAAQAMKAVFSTAPRGLPSGGKSSAPTDPPEVAEAVHKALCILAELCAAAGLPYLAGDHEGLMNWLDTLIAGTQPHLTPDWNTLLRAAPSSSEVLRHARQTPPETWRRRWEQAGNTATNKILAIVEPISARCVRKRLHWQDETTLDEVTASATVRIFASIARYDSAKGIFAHWANRLAHNEVVDFLRKRRPGSNGISFPIDGYQEETHTPGLAPGDWPGYLEATSVPPVPSEEWDDYGLSTAGPPFGLDNNDFTKAELNRLALMRWVARDDTEPIRDGGDIAFLERCWYDAPRGGRPEDDDGNRIPSVYTQIAQVHLTIKDPATLRKRADRYRNKYIPILIKLFALPRMPVDSIR